MICPHNWIGIFSYGTDMEERVVRWCKLCGSYRINDEGDNRVYTWGEIHSPENNK